jgi:arsenite methyltransferase
VTSRAPAKPDYGIDAPYVLRNLLLSGAACLLLGLFGPPRLHLGGIDLALRPMLFWTGILLLLQGLLYLWYVKAGKFYHRDYLLSLHHWSGSEQLLDVGCGRGLLLAAAVKRIAARGGDGRGTGIDIWSMQDMGGNSEAATRRNLVLEGISDRCTLLAVPAQDMAFPDASFDVIVSNLCLHNIYDRATRERALQQIVRVLKPGGVAILSDYKLVGDYGRQLQRAGLAVEYRWSTLLCGFPPLRIVLGRRQIG